MIAQNKTYLHGLDQLRAFAAFLVFYWHAVHGWSGMGLSYVPENTFMSFMEEGHTGVSLFIVITGFIFTYIIGDKEVIYTKFLYNRFIRIFPLLFVITLFATFTNNGVNKGDPLTLLKFFNLFGGGTTWGGWTLVIEFQFYLMFPIIYTYFRDQFNGSFKKYLPFIFFIVLAMAFRILYFAHKGSFQDISYYSIFGRIDQFMLGVIAALLLKDIKKHIKTPITLYLGGGIIFIVSFTILIVFYDKFNQAGGYYLMPSYPSPYKLWLVMSTIEGVFYAAMIIGWILFSSNWSNKFSRFIAYLGSVSYSTYLIHIPMIYLGKQIVWNYYNISFSSDKFINLSLISVLIIYPLVIMFSAISYELIEKPFLSQRIKYTK